MKVRMKSMIWNIRKKKAFNQNSKNKQELKKNEDRIRSLWDISKCTNIRIIGMLKEERKSKKLKLI